MASVGFLLARLPEAGRWVVMVEGEYLDQEETLHQLVATEPRFLAQERDGSPVPTVLVASHFRLPSGDELDLLLLDAEGVVSLCELKRKLLTRKTVGQLLDYAAQVAEAPEALLSPLKEAAERLRELYPEEADSEALATEALLQALRSPRLVLLGADMDEDVLRIARWLQGQRVRFECYTYRRYLADGLEVVVPENRTPWSEPPPLPTSETPWEVFWREMLSRLGQRIPHNRTRSGKSWLDFPTGTSGVRLEWKGRGTRLGVQVVVRNKEENKALVERILGSLEELRQEIPGAWQPIEGEGNFYLRLERDTGRPVRDATEEVRQWAVDVLVRLHAFLIPRLKQWKEALDE